VLRESLALQEAWAKVEIQGALTNMEAPMLDTYTKFILTVIAICLLAITVRVGVVPEAQAGGATVCKIEGPVEVRVTRLPDRLGTERYRPVYFEEAK